MKLKKKIQDHLRKNFFSKRDKQCNLIHISLNTKKMKLD